MEIHKVEYRQFIKAPLSEVWDFFSSPANLAKITPSEMNFKIVKMDGNRMFRGQKIQYRVTVMPLIRVTWVTEITEVKENQMFVDEQRKGPYSLWRHRHTFNEMDGGVEMTDVIEYAIPFGILGSFANKIYVSNAVKGIFEHRYKVVEQLFNNHEMN